MLRIAVYIAYSVSVICFSLLMTPLVVYPITSRCFRMYIVYFIQANLQALIWGISQFMGLEHVHGYITVFNSDGAWFIHMTDMIYTVLHSSDDTDSDDYNRIRIQ